MRHVRCAGVVFVTDGKILLEDRRKISKHGEHWSFFGGSIEQRETIEGALLREIKEEISYNLKNHVFFRKYDFCVHDLHLTYYMYLAPIPPLTQLRIHKMAEARVFTLKQALRLRITNIDKRILRDISRRLS